MVENIGVEPTASSLQDLRSSYRELIPHIPLNLLIIPAVTKNKLVAWYASFIIIEWELNYRTNITPRELHLN